MSRTWVGFQQLIELVGQEAATALCRQYGGQHFYVGRVLSKKEVQALGGDREAAGKLCGAYGASEIALPNCLIRRPVMKTRIAELLEQGVHTSQAARICGCSVRHVQAVKRDIGLTHGRRGKGGGRVTL